MQAIEAELKPLNKKVERMKSDMTTLKDYVSITRKIKIFKKILKTLIYY